MRRFRKPAMATEDRIATPEGLDPDATPFELPPVEGLPFDEDSEEAEAIRQVIEAAERKRGAKL